MKKYNHDEVHLFMLAYQKEFGLPPLIREIQRGCNIAWRSSVRYILQNLLLQGKVILRAPSKCRNRYYAVEDDK